MAVMARLRSAGHFLQLDPWFIGRCKYHDCPLSTSNQASNDSGALYNCYTFFTAHWAQFGCFVFDLTISSHITPSSHYHHFQSFPGCIHKILYSGQYIFLYWPKCAHCVFYGYLVEDSSSFRIANNLNHHHYSLRNDVGQFVYPNEAIFQDASICIYPLPSYLSLLSFWWAFQITSTVFSPQFGLIHFEKDNH